MLARECEGLGKIASPRLPRRGAIHSDLRQAIRPLHGSIRDIDPLLAPIGDVHFVFIGEAMQGARNFHRMRAEITKRLIVEMCLSAICIEGDRSDAYRVDRYARGAGDDAEAVESLAGFTRFPTWTWGNAEVLDFTSWLREFNDRREELRRPKAGFYGLDVYSKCASLDAVIGYLDKDETRAVEPLRTLGNLGARRSSGNVS
jgi:erythromycin esterase-like protein